MKVRVCPKCNTYNKNINTTCYKCFNDISSIQLKYVASKKFMYNPLLIPKILRIAGISLFIASVISSFYIFTTLTWIEVPILFTTRTEGLFSPFIKTIISSIVALSTLIESPTFFGTRTETIFNPMGLSISITLLLVGTLQFIITFAIAKIIEQNEDILSNQRYILNHIIKTENYKTENYT